MKHNHFIPISKDDLKERGWTELDIILITGDAYVDHPSYGAAVIARVLENAGFKVGIIAQPGRHKDDDFLELGRPRLFFGITSGNTDSMIANYTANRKPRKIDDYSPGGKPGLRPDRALIVYANKIRGLFGNKIPIIIGGVEASLRRLAHYDYWDNKVRRSILLDSRANMLVYGMGEKQIVEIAERLGQGEKISSLNNIRGTVIIRKEISALENTVIIPSFEDVKNSKEMFNKAFKRIYGAMNPFTAKALVQEYHNRFAVQLPPQLPLSQKELDRIYELPYTRKYHPKYTSRGGVKGLETVKFSLISCRGCCGECSFCGLYMHQGRIVQSRSPESISREARLLSQSEGFYGVITDLGGPTVNLYGAGCKLWDKKGFCADKHCLTPARCENLKINYSESLNLYRKIKEIPGVKHLFLASGFRYDLFAGNDADLYLKEICRSHISGQMKVAPEHISANILRLMNKPGLKIFERFVEKFRKANAALKKNQFLVNYFISGHPGSTLEDSLTLALYLAKQRLPAEQIQDFIPSPMTLSTCLYYTGIHPFTGEKVYSAKTFQERKMQRALIQYKNPKNRKLVIEALRLLNALPLLNQLIGRRQHNRRKPESKRQ